MTTAHDTPESVAALTVTVIPYTDEDDGPAREMDNWRMLVIGRLGAFPSLFTPLGRFGMFARFDPDGSISITYSRPGSATYPDGKPRRWQGRGKAVIDIRPSLAGHVIKAIRAIHAPTNRPEDPVEAPE